MTRRSTQFILLALLTFCTSLTLDVFGQTPGTIYKPAGSALGRSVLDPNGDGFVSATNAGFTGSTDYGAASELKMIPLPIFGKEPTGDITTGGSGGHTDIVSNDPADQYSCFILYKKVGTDYYLIFRFRIGNASTAAKGYSVLFDTDGIFGNQHSPDNPGFDKEVVMQTGNSGGIVIYNHSGATATEVTRFPLDEYSQRSVAKTNVDGSTDYFYDFFVPYPALDLAFDPVRTVSVTITSASSGLVGTKSDFNGINDKLYGNDPIAISKALVNAFPAVPITSLVEGYTFPPMQSNAPVVNAPIRAGATSISGSSTEDPGATVEVFKNGVSLGTTTVGSGNTWTLTGVSGLVLADQITARVTGTNKSQSAVSNTVVVQAAAPCYTNRPVITAKTNGSQSLTVQWSNPAGTAISANSVEIKIYDFRTGSPVLINTYAPKPAYIVAGTPNTSGSVLIDLNPGNAGMNQTTFQNGYFFATATVNGCESRYSDAITGEYTAPTAPIIITTPIIASATTARSVTVENKHSTAATILLYIGSTQIGSAASVATNTTTTFSYTGFASGDSVFARALVSNVLSGLSNAVVVTKSTTQADPPVITGSYNTASTSVSGTSTEPAGSTIYLYSNGVQIGTATVNAGGAWTVTGLNLGALGGQSLTAKVENDDKTLSNASNSVIINTVITPPAVTGSYVAGATSISGNSGSGTVTVYVDQSPIGTVTGVSGSWTLSGITTDQLFRGAVIHATNSTGSNESAASNTVTVTGPLSFSAITKDLTNGSTITSVVAGTNFNLELAAKDAISGGGNVFTGFTGTVNVSSSNSAIGTGGGTSNAFSSGELTRSTIPTGHTMSLTTAGSNRTITVINSNDPTATGSATITVTAAAASKLSLNAPADFTPGASRAAYTVTITDAYGNPVNATSNVVVNLSASPSASGSFFDAASAGTQINNVTIPSGSSSANFYMAASGGASFVVTASAPATPSLADATDNIIAGFVWQGDISTDWNTDGNWEGNAVPAIWATVIIPQAIPHKPVLDQNRNVGDIFIGENLTVTLNGFTLTIGGALTGSGSFIGSATSGLNITDAPSPASSVALGTLYFDQTTNGTTNRLNSLIINRSQSGTVATLGNNVHVTTLRLEDGIIDIADANMMLTGLDPSHVGDANSYVRTSGIGLLKKTITNGGGNFKFPVGNSAFNPVTLTNNTTVASEEFGVQVIDEVYDNGTGRGNQSLVNRRRVTRTWEITKASSGNATGTGVGFAFQWNVNETFGSGFDVNNLAMFHHNRTTWSPQTGTVTRDGNTRTMTFSGYTGSFSPFSLQDQTGTLPVVWGGFTAKAEGSNVQLNWSTVTEIDSKDFVVQHSVDGIRWSDIGIVASNGNSRLLNDYAFTHSAPAAGNNYYRLMERSFTGAVQFSSIVSVSMPLSGKLIIFGNPVTNGILKFSLPKSANVTLNDVQGRILYRGKMEAGIQQIDLQGKPSGLYYLKAGSAQRTVLIN